MSLDVAIKILRIKTSLPYDKNRCISFTEFQTGLDDATLSFENVLLFFYDKKNQK